MSNQNDDLEPIDELEPHEDLESPGAVSSEGRSEGSSDSADAPMREAGIGDKRELEQAPLELRKAAQILLAGSLLPFYVGLSFATAGAAADFRWIGEQNFPWGVFLGAKALALLGGYIFHEGYKATHGGEEKGPIAGLAKAHAMAPMILAGVIWIFALIFATTGSIDALQGEKLEAKPWTSFVLIVELFTMILAMTTTSHIYGYEHGGKFNPIFPLAFLGPAVAGVVQFLALGQVNSGGHSGIGYLALLGSGVCAAGGIMAMMIMVKAMKEAKAEGERKAALVREKRKADREAKRAAREAAKAEQ